MPTTSLRTPAQATPRPPDPTHPRRPTAGRAVPAARNGESPAPDPLARLPSRPAPTSLLHLVFGACGWRRGDVGPSGAPRPSHLTCMVRAPRKLASAADVAGDIAADVAADVTGVVGRDVVAARSGIDLPQLPAQPLPQPPGATSSATPGATGRSVQAYEDDQTQEAIEGTRQDTPVLGMV